MAKKTRPSHLRIYVDDNPDCHPMLREQYVRYLKRGGNPSPYRGHRFGQWLALTKKNLLARLYRVWWVKHPELW